MPTALDLTVEFPFDTWDPVPTLRSGRRPSTPWNGAGSFISRGSGSKCDRKSSAFCPTSGWTEDRRTSTCAAPSDDSAVPAGVATICARLRGLLQRYAQQAQRLVSALFPPYLATLRSGNTSLRPCEIAGRPTSRRHDDTRLHTDAFPSSPTGGARILRVFTNVDPSGAPRVWQVGEPFPDMAVRFLPRVRRQLPGEAWLLRALMFTKRRRTEYDHLMRELHDHVKFDMDYQRNASGSASSSFQARPGSSSPTRCCTACSADG